MAQRVMNHRSIPLALLAGLGLVACSNAPAADDKGEEQDAPVDGSFDSFYRPTVQDFELGTPAAATISRDTRFHAFDFELTGDAMVSLFTAPGPDGDVVDTVMYLYREGERGWGRYVARNDDADGLFSRIDAELGAGRYRVLVKGYGWWVQGPFVMDGTCDGAGCGVVEPEQCAFGEEYRDLRDGPDFETTLSVRVTDLERLSALRRSQLLAAVRVAWSDVRSPEEALATVDSGEANLLELTHRASGARFVAWEYGAGDNSYGAVFAEADAIVAARIEDGFFYGCTVTDPEGPEGLPGAGEDCTRELGCDGELRCEGFVAEAGAGKCVSHARLEGEGDECGGDRPACGEGLICAGAALDPSWGLCNPAWMRGTFTDEAAVAIPDEGTVERTIYAYGLATVSTDVEISVRLTHNYPGDLYVTLSNPLGTTSVVFDGETDAFDSETLALDLALSGCPGDEDVTGAWTLRIEDRVARDEGTLERWDLTLTSRWD